MKKLDIFIDYAGKEGSAFALDLKRRILRKLKEKTNVIRYEDLQINEDTDEHEWERGTSAAIQKSDVIIPILSSEYLSFVTPEIEESFSSTIDSPGKYLLPIFLKESAWGKYAWVVRSNLTPSNGESLLSQSEENKEELLSGFIKTISDIAKRVTEQRTTQTPPQVVGSADLVFVSHDHDDADFAELLKLKLEKEGLSAWIDSERLKIGEDWREEIDQAIEGSKAVIAIMSPEAKKSEYVTYEWAFAWGKNKKIFPIMLKQTPLHPRLESLQYLDFTNRGSRPWEKLINAIKDTEA